jgi:hypothetical protein
MSNPLSELQELKDLGLQPIGGIVWLGIGVTPPKRSAVFIDSDRLPTDQECKAVAGLDVILSYYGYITKYGTLKRLCESLYQARPRRLQVVDLDTKKIAFLRLGGKL